MQVYRNEDDDEMTLKCAREPHTIYYNLYYAAVYCILYAHAQAKL